VRITMKPKDKICILILSILLFANCNSSSVDNDNLSYQTYFSDSISLSDIPNRFVFNTRIWVVFGFYYDTIPYNITVGRTSNTFPYFKISGEYRIKDTTGFGINFGYYSMAYSHNNDTGNVILLWNQLAHIAASKLGISISFSKLCLFLPDGYFVNANRINIVSALP
jgi:hypothetical protein